MDLGTTIRLKKFEDHFNGTEVRGSNTWVAGKGKVFVCVLLGVENLDGSDPLDPNKVLTSMGWTPPSAPKPKAEKKREYVAPNPDRARPKRSKEDLKAIEETMRRNKGLPPGSQVIGVATVCEERSERVIQAGMRGHDDLTYTSLVERVHGKSVRNVRPLPAIEKRTALWVICTRAKRKAWMIARRNVANSDLGEAINAFNRSGLDTKIIPQIWEVR